MTLLAFKKSVYEMSEEDFSHGQSGWVTEATKSRRHACVLPGNAVLFGISGLT